jgi:predicted dehydrogenase
MKTSVVVIGTGSAGLQHLKALEVLGVRALALPARSGRRASLEAAGLEAVDSLAEARRRGARGCVIATDTGRHAQDALAALDLGFDVLIEKPLAANARQARRIAAVASRRGRKAFVACVLRFSPSLAVFRARLPRIGVLHAVRVECRSYMPDWNHSRPYAESYRARRGEGGVLLDLIHEIDYASWIFGAPHGVLGRAWNVGRLGIREEEAAEIAWETPAGFPLTLGLDYLTRPPLRRMTAYGKNGTLVWDAVRSRVTLSNPEGRERSWSARETAAARFLAQTRAFLRAIDGVKDPRAATLAEGLRALEICDAVRSGRRLR